MCSGVVHKQLLWSKKEKLAHSLIAKMLRWWLFFFFLNQSSCFKFFPSVFSLFYMEAGEVTFWALLIGYLLSQLTSFNNKPKSPRIQKYLRKTCFHLDAMSMLSPHIALTQATLPSKLEYDMLVFWLIRNGESYCQDVTEEKLTVYVDLLYFQIEHWEKSSFQGVQNLASWTSVELSAKQQYHPSVKSIKRLLCKAMLGSFRFSLLLFMHQQPFRAAVPVLKVFSSVHCMLVMYRIVTANFHKRAV